MRLADFIELEMEIILSRWEEFAATLLPGVRKMDSLALRDHAPQILREICADLRAPQTREEQETKSRGHAPPAADETAAQTHAVLRATSGFSIRQLVGEYRALRASVLRLYLDRVSNDVIEPTDIGRFNEGIDQAIAESVDYFSNEVDRWRNIFLGVLGHDLRGPLNSIQLTAEYLSLKNPRPELEAHIERLLRSGQRMADLLDDLLDYNRVSVGGHLDLHLHAVDLIESCRQEVELMRSAYPAARIDFDASGSCCGVWDESRLRQALGNLIANAIRYGSDEPVRVVVQTESDWVRLAVDNSGPTLAPTELDRVFEPLVRGSAGNAHAEPGHMGLGLFIVRQAAEAHGGKAEAQSKDGQTRFSILLPKNASKPDSDQV